MKINPYIFRGYDLRGVVDKDLNPIIVEHLGKVHGTLLKRRGVTSALVGRDFRATSPEYSEAIIKGLRWAGIDVVDIGMELVGTFYWAQHFLKIRGGVYVTASHNPAEYNGFKFAVDLSVTLVTEGMQQLRSMFENDDWVEGKQVGSLTKKNIRADYFSDILKRLPIKKRFKVVIDSSCATSGDIAPDLLRQSGCEVVENNTKLDPTFPLGTADPTEEIVLQRLSEEVMAVKADIGFSYDADGDRIGIVDNRGRIIWNDVLVALFAVDILHYYPGSIIMYNTLCSKVVEESIIKAQGKPFMWRTGHSFLKKKNQEIKAPFIGELSGHFFFSADFYNHDDGLYATLRLLSYLDRTKQSLAVAIDALPLYISSPEIKLYAADNKKVKLIEKIIPMLKRDFPDADVISDERAGDGVRLDLPAKMLVIRYSQNGPYVTVKFEAKKEVDYIKLKNYLNKLLHQFSEIDWQSKISVNIGALE